MSRKLISGQTPAREINDRGFVDGPSGLGRDDANDALAEALIRNTYYQRIPNAIMRLQCLFDFFGKYLFTAGIDAGRATPEQDQRAIRRDAGKIARKRVSHASDRAKGLGALFWILIITSRYDTAIGDHANLIGTGDHFLIAVIENLSRGVADKTCRLARRQRA